MLNIRYLNQSQSSKWLMISLISLLCTLLTHAKENIYIYIDRLTSNKIVNEKLKEDKGKRVKSLLKNKWMKGEEIIRNRSYYNVGKVMEFEWEILEKKRKEINVNQLDKFSHKKVFNDTND